MTEFVEKLCGKNEIPVRKIEFLSADIQSFIQNVHSLWITFVVDAFLKTKNEISIDRTDLKQNFFSFLHRFSKLIHIFARFIVDNHRIEPPKKLSTPMKSDVDSIVKI